MINLYISEVHHVLPGHGDKWIYSETLDSNKSNISASSTMNMDKISKLDDKSAQHVENMAMSHTDSTGDVEGTHQVTAAEIKTTSYMIYFSVVVAFSGWMVGFDTGYTGAIIIMPVFNRMFGQCEALPNGTAICALSATQQSVLFVSSLFVALGCVLAAPISYYLGRKGTLQVGCLLVCIGSAGQLGTSGNYTNFSVCKCIAAIGAGTFTVGGPTYGVETAPPAKRGALVAMYGAGLSIGSLVVAAVCLGSSEISDDWSWKIPIICQIPISILYALLVVSFPESPRWLMTKNRTSEARTSFARFYGAEPDSATVSLQMKSTQEDIDAQRELSATTSWTEIFKLPYLHRTIISSSILIGTSICGIWFAQPYAALFIQRVGISSPFVINVAFSSCLVAGGITAPLLVEVLGRRLSLLIGYTVMFCCMLILSAVSTGLGIANPVAQRVLVALFCIWGFVFSGFIGPSAWLISNEVQSVQMRTYAQPFCTMLGQTFAFAASFWTPYMLSSKYGNMGTNVGYFYAGITFLVILQTFFMVPETAKLSLEQIDDFFRLNQSVRGTSLAGNKRIARGENLREVGKIL